MWRIEKIHKETVIHSFISDDMTEVTEQYL
jgi:hypothetical protein